MRWEWNLSGPGSFSVSRVLATVYRSGGVYAIIGIIARFLLPGICAVLIVMGVGTWTAGDSEGSGSVGAGVFLLLGVVFLAIVIPIFVHRRRFVSRAASAIGVVTDLKSTEMQAGMQSYNPVVQFQPHDGRMVEFESDTGGPEESSYPPGGQVEVLYDPLNPEDARIKDYMMLWGIPLLLVCSRERTPSDPPRYLQLCGRGKLGLGFLAYAYTNPRISRQQYS
jgi:hypothetical protein